MHSAVHKTNSRKLLVLGILVAAAAIAYLFVDVSFSNERLFRYAMKIRIPKLMVMLVASAAIGGATIVFQTIIHNTIVTPCQLGMNSLYTLIHTAVVFFAGSGSFLAVNANVSFVVDLFLMSTTAVLVYSYLFKKTNYNVLYVLLIGTVLTSFFGSIQSTLTRIMDPNEYDSLLATLVASFNNVNSEIILAAVLVLAGIVFVLRKELALLDVLSLGRHQAINLGVDYDRAIRKLLLGVTLCIATATAMVGPISFLGLIIANLSRQFLKTYRHSQLIMGSVFFGMFVLAAGQMISEQIFVYAIPVSVFITVGGGGYFLYLLLRKGGVRRVKIRGVKKQYHGKTVVDSVSFEIQKGKVTALIGPNGAGKSTVMSILSRLIAKDEGVVEFEGKKLEHWKSKELSKHLAILTQSNHIEMKLTVRELVAFGRFPHSGGRMTKQDKEIVAQAIDYMELKEFEDRFLDELSGGQRQRAYIAMVIAQDTEYVFLDEPTNNLDIYHASNMMKMVRKLSDELGKTVILVLHEINYAAFYSDYICAFKNGKIAKYGTVEEVIQKEVLSEIYQVDFEILNIKGKPLSVYY